MWFQELTPPLKILHTVGMSLYDKYLHNAVDVVKHGSNTIIRFSPIVKTL